MYDPSARRSLDVVLDTPIRNRRGDLVALRDVVTPMEVPSVSQILHRDGVRTATSFAGWLEAEVLDEHRTAGVDVYITGEAEQTEEVMGDLTWIAALAVIGIFMVVWLSLESFLCGR